MSLDDADKDYKDMRRLQEKYIKAAHERIALEEENGRLHEALMWFRSVTETPDDCELTDLSLDDAFKRCAHVARKALGGE